MELITIARTAKNLEQAAELMKESGWDNYGIEYVGVEGREVGYINRGDTYSATILQEDEGKLFVSTWGDWLESAEQAYEEDTDTIRCGYCGEFTPMNEESWRDVVCESCGHKVDGSK